jgi:hypothetical protein
MLISFNEIYQVHFCLEYPAEERPNENYIFEIRKNYFVDGTQETCECHAGRRVLGRLANHANQKKKREM